MNHLLSILLTAILCATASAQTIKTLGYNSTNGQVVAATNVVWTNAFGFSTNTVADSVRTNLGLGATWLTNTNVTNFRTAVGLGENSEPSFLRILVTEGTGTNGPVEFAGDGISFPNESLKAFYRGDLGLPLAALTNTSNVTIMRALAGSTDTNQPYSGLISFQDFADDTHTITVSNGIITSYTAP